LNKTETGFTLSGPQGDDILIQVERLHFADHDVALDTAPTGSAGQAVALWHAALHRMPTDAELGQLLAHFDGGRSEIEVAAVIINTLAPHISDTDLVRTLYTNVVGTAPGQAEIDHYTGILERHEMSKAELFQFAAETELNHGHFAELIANGIAYTPVTGV